MAQINPERSTFPIPRLSASQPHLGLAFLFDHGLRNEACLLEMEFTAEWQSRKNWRHDCGEPNWELLQEKFGNAEVPVLIGDDRDYTTMTFSRFIETFVLPSERDEMGGKMKGKKKPTAPAHVAYVKDWHFQSGFPHADAYTLPSFLRADWINNELWTSEENGENNIFGGDYRFLYCGTEGSWTRFHSDVLNSFSWSANIFGQKLWYLLRPGAERHFTTTPTQSTATFIEDICSQRELWAEAGVMEFVQEEGEIVFVPSGWYHQVHNLRHTLSINHNVVNACNIEAVLRLVVERQRAVLLELADLETAHSREEYWELCQRVLFADCRMDMPKLVKFMELVAKSRQQRMEESKLDGNNTSPESFVADPFCLAELGHDSHQRDIMKFKSCIHCMLKVKEVLIECCECPSPREQNMCHSCSHFLDWLEYRTALTVGEFARGISSAERPSELTP